MKLAAAVLAIGLPTVLWAQEAPSLPGIGEVMPAYFFGVCATNGMLYLENRRVQFGETVLFVSDGQSYLIAGEEIVDRPGVLAVLSNQDTRTVSVIMLYPDGVACEILTGENFEPQ